MAITNLIRFNNLGGDIFGGVTTAVVSLPLALAFGGGGPRRTLWGSLWRLFCRPVWRYPNVDL
jgi:SulP family sulfate permease